MSSVLDNLSGKDKQLLIALYETEHYKALRSLIEATRINIATQALDAEDFGQMKFMQGQAFALKALHGKVKELHKESKENKTKS